MKAHRSGWVYPARLFLPALLFLSALLLPEQDLAAEALTDPPPAEEVTLQTEPLKAAANVSLTGTATAEEVRPKPAGEKRFYTGLDLSYINFEARNDAGPEAAAYGLMLVAGYRLNDYLSVEGGANWLPLADPGIILPIPLMWAPAEKGFYANLAGGMRLNLTRYSSNRVVPWLSLWYTGHYVISDYSVNGSGPTYGAGLEWKTKKGKKRQIAVRIHDFNGALEVVDRNGNMEYGRTDIRAVEVALTLFGG